MQRFLAVLAVFSALTLGACQSLEPLPHGALEAMINEARAAAEAYDGVEVTGFGIQCNPPTCAQAFILIDHPVPGYEAAMNVRFGGHIVFLYGRPELL